MQEFGVEFSDTIVLQALARLLFYTIFAWILMVLNVEIGKKMGYIKRFVYSIIISIGAYILYIAIENPLLDYISINRFFRGDQLFYIFFILFATYLSGWFYALLRKQYQTGLDNEYLKNETLSSKIDALTNRINPHFFFNALNSLHSLILEDQKERSLAYVANMSNVFRYILQSEKRGVVELTSELNFLTAYIFMLKVKYENKLIFDIKIPDKYKSYTIPVLSLLPIIENVAKHNEISNSAPMTISIYTEESKIIISNPIQLKLEHYHSSGIGIKDLKERFFLLTGKQIEVEQTETLFKVGLPLIKDIRKSSQIW